LVRAQEEEQRNFFKRFHIINTNVGHQLVLPLPITPKTRPQPGFLLNKKMQVFIAPPKGERELEMYKIWLTANGFEPIVLERRIQHIHKPLILCGGADLGKNIQRDSLEFGWIESAIIHGQPIIGVCRGMQVLNRYFGGQVTDLEDLITEDHRSDLFDDDVDHSERLSQFHFVVDEFRNAMRVNSRHHQYCSEIAPNFKVTYWAFGDMVPEAIEDADRKIWAVQWHPERDESDDNEYPLNKLRQ
jgi:GMP synthase-like glutamine amidotransferase